MVAGTVPAEPFAAQVQPFFFIYLVHTLVVIGKTFLPQQNINPPKSRNGS